MKKTTILFVLVGCAVLITRLLWPLSSDAYEITFDEAAITKKRDHLKRVTELSRSQADRPNIVILLADDLGKLDITLYADNGVPTPHIDSIGKQGVVFTDAYCTSPTCSPSRAGLLAGRYQQRFGYETQIMNRYPRNRLEYGVFKYFIDTGDWHQVPMRTVPRQEDIVKQGLPPSEITIGELLQASGYATAIHGKWHLGNHEPFWPHERGFDEHYGFYEAFSLFAPVDTPDIVAHHVDAFDDRHMWKQEREGTCAIRRNGEVIEDDDYFTFRIADESRRYIEQHKDEPFFLFVSFNAPHAPFQAPRRHYDRFAHIDDHGERVYAGMIAALDDAVGSIVQQLDELGLTDNTIVWFASDNGAAAYTGVTDNAPLKGGKFNYFEGGLNVPMAVQWKGTVPSGVVCDEPVSLLDIFTTAASIAGAPLPEDRAYDGVDLLPLVTGETTTLPREALFWRTHYAKAIRMGEWKLIVDDAAGHAILYNLSEDKEEQRDVAAEYPDVVQELRRRLDAWNAELVEPAWPRVMNYYFHFDGVDFYCPV